MNFMQIAKIAAVVVVTMAVVSRVEPVRKIVFAA